jgi:hypothetical protein
LLGTVQHAAQIFVSFLPFLLPVILLVLQMDWVHFLRRAYGKSGVQVQPDHPVIFLAGEKSLGGIIQFIESADPRVLGQYRLESLVCLAMCSKATKIGEP